MIRQQPNSFYDEALSALIKNQIAADTTLTAEIFHKLAVKSSDPIDSSLAEIMGKLSYADRSVLAKTIELLESEQRKDIFTKLNHAAQDFQIIIEEKSNKFRFAVILGLSSLTISLAVIIIGQLKHIKQVNEKLRLSTRNSQLVEENIAMQDEINHTRSKIDLITAQSIKRLKNLKAAVESLEKNPKQSAELFKDLNIITTYEEGLLRFKIQNIIEGVSTKKIENLKRHFKENDILVLKMTIMNFSSKEIALILGVTPQHVQNVRSKMKARIKAITEEGYDQMLASIKAEFTEM